jgi:putative membrane protein
MSTRDRSASAARTLSRKRRLHPLAILFPFNSYSRPPLLGRSIRFPKWVGLSLLFVVGLIVDYYSADVTVLDDGAVLVQSDEISWGHLSVLIIGLGTLAAFLLVRWWSFRWWIEDDAIWTSGGIFNEWRRRVTFDHIVTIDRTSTPLRRLFGVSRIAIETTAVDQASPDVLFGYLSNRNANLLEDLLITKLVFDGEENEARRFDPLSVDRLGWRELILAGATTLQIGRALVVLYTAILFFQAQLAPSLVIEFDSTESTVVELSPVLFLFVPILGIIFVLWLVSTVYFVVSFARFRLGKHEDWLILETGVIRRSRRLIKASAIQGLEIARSPLQRYFREKRAMLRMRLPAYGSPPIYAMVLHPAVTDATLPSLTSQIAGMDPATSEAMCGKGVHRLATRSRNAYITYWPMRIAAGCGVLLALLLTLQPQIWWWALLPLILAVPFAILGWLAWRSAGWYAGNGEWLLVQRGAFTLTSIAARIDRIQYVSWSQSLFSRANATFSLAISVATSGGAGLLSRILASLRGPVDPSLVRIRAVDATDAAKIAISSGFERSLPPELISGRSDKIHA